MPVGNVVGFMPVSVVVETLALVSALPLSLTSPVRAIPLMPVVVTSVSALPAVVLVPTVVRASPVVDVVLTLVSALPFVASTLFTTLVVPAVIPVIHSLARTVVGRANAANMVRLADAANQLCNGGAVTNASAAIALIARLIAAL